MRNILSSWARWSIRKPSGALGILVGISLLLSIGFFSLDFEMTFFSIMPKNSPATRDLEIISEEFPFASAILLVVQDPEGSERREDINRAIAALGKEFSSLQWKESIEQVYTSVDRSFLESHALMLLDDKQFEDLLDPNTLLDLGSRLTDEDSEELSRTISELKDAAGRAARGIHIEQQELETIIDRLLFGQEYLISEDGSAGLLFLLPSFTINDIMMLRDVEQIEHRAAQISETFGLSTGLTGMTVVAKDELVTSEQGLGLSMGIAFILVILLITLAFRMRSSVVMTGIPLILGILWTSGAAGLLIGRLNIMTAMYMVALIGLGIDYAIHLLAGYIQFRDDGLSFEEAIERTYTTNGPGIITGALTTAAAFFSLSFMETAMARELGIVAGIGIICQLAAMLLSTSTFLCLRERRAQRTKKGQSIPSTRWYIRSDLASPIGSAVLSHKVFTLLSLVGMTIVLGSFAPSVELEDNIMNMEAEGLRSIELQEELVELFSMAPDGLHILTDDYDTFYRIAEPLEKLPTVASVESVASYLPPVELQEQRIEQLADLKEAVQQASILHEAGALLDPDGLGPLLGTQGFDAGAIDPEEVADFLYRLEGIILARLTKMIEDPLIELEDLPRMVSDSFIAEDRSLYLMNINPTENPWEGDFRQRFTSEVATVTDDATGMILAADQLTHMASVDGRRSSLIALVVIFFILLIDFRNIKLALLSFLPLLCSGVSLFGIMALTGIRFDFVNIIAIPLLIGIGIDDAVHISHRYLIEGEGAMRQVIAKTGSAVLLTTITTVIAFASFIPSIMRAMRSTGIVLSVAMLLAYLYSVLLHPILLVLVRERLRLSLSPWGRKEDER